MRTSLIVILSMVFLVTGASQAGQRERGTGDSARHPRPTGDPEQAPVRPRGADRELTRMERLDPAVRQFWSDRCVGQRRYGLSHSKDCDNPAYSGGGRYYYPYRRYDYDDYRPRGYIPRDYAPRGGATLMDRGSRRSGTRTPVYPDERRARGRSSFYGR